MLPWTCSRRPPNLRAKGSAGMAPSRDQRASGPDQIKRRMRAGFPHPAAQSEQRKGEGGERGNRCEVAVPPKGQRSSQIGACSKGRGGLATVLRHCVGHTSVAEAGIAPSPHVCADVTIS